MGKQYIPVVIGDRSYKLYLDNLVKIYKTPRRRLLPVPEY